MFESFQQLIKDPNLGWGLLLTGFFIGIAFINFFLRPFLLRKKINYQIAAIVEKDQDWNLEKPPKKLDFFEIRRHIPVLDEGDPWFFGTSGTRFDLIASRGQNQVKQFLVVAEQWMGNVLGASPPTAKFGFGIGIIWKFHNNTVNVTLEHPEHGDNKHQDPIITGPDSNSFIASGGEKIIQWFKSTPTGTTCWMKNGWMAIFLPANDKSAQAAATQLFLLEKSFKIIS